MTLSLGTAKSLTRELLGDVSHSSQNMCKQIHDLNMKETRANQIV